MEFDVLIIGCGLSGLFTGCLASRRGMNTLIVAQGIGGTHLGAGTVGVFNGDAAALEELFASADHPYGIAGRSALLSALDELKTICAEAGYPLRGQAGQNFVLPTAAGSTRTACLVPETMASGDLRRDEPLAVAALPGFRDFAAALAAANLNARLLVLPLPSVNGSPPQRARASVGLAPAVRASLRRAPTTYATDMARLFDRPDYRQQVIAEWRPLIGGARRLRIGIPAVLGLEHSLAAKQHLEEALGVELFEIPLPPPSVPGMRLFNILRRDFENHGGRFILGPTVSGQIERGQATVTAEAPGRTKPYRAATVILASGGFLNGGLAAEFDGQIRESVFGLPVAASSRRSEWTSESFFGSHPFARFGLRVNKNLQPLGADGKPAANLRAVGSILAGADRLSEGSREGIELATAYRAIELSSPGRAAAHTKPNVTL